MKILKSKLFFTLFLATKVLIAQTPNTVRSINSFSIDLYKSIVVKESNVFFSPISAYLALAMVYEGAYNDTKKDFEHILYISDSAEYKSLLALAEEIASFRDSSNYLKLSNSIWIENDFPVEEEYQGTVIEKFSSSVFSFDNKYPEIVAIDINHWISENTSKRITHVINPDDIDISTVLFIVNATDFSGKWAYEFDENLTKPKTFITIDNKLAEINFLNQKRFLKYYENCKFQFVSIPYEGGEKSFCILLPKKISGIFRVEKELKHIDFVKILENSCSYREVILSFPKFKMETEYSFEEDLKKLGLATAFSTAADFSGISNTDGLLIGDVKHNAYISIDEKKTEAAAATVVKMDVVSSVSIVSKNKPVTFNADHPFIFFIIDTESKGILFMGRFMEYL